MTGAVRLSPGQNFPFTDFIAWFPGKGDRKESKKISLYHFDNLAESICNRIIFIILQSGRKAFAWKRLPLFSLVYGRSLYRSCVYPWDWRSGKNSSSASGRPVLSGNRIKSDENGCCYSQFKRCSAINIVLPQAFNLPMILAICAVASMSKLAVGSSKTMISGFVA